MQTNSCWPVSYEIGDLVWIPANTSLQYYIPGNDYRGYSDPENTAGWWKITEKKEPTYGLVLCNSGDRVRVLVGEEEFWVKKSQIYGVNNDN